MIKQRHKQLLFLFLTLAGVSAMLGLILTASKVSTTAASGAPAEEANRKDPEITPDADKLTTWMPDQWKGTRSPDVGNRRAIEATYVRAWTAIGRYAMSGNRDPVNAWFTGPAKAAVLAVPHSETSPVWSLGHRLELRFFSNDGSIAGLRDHRSRFVRLVDSPNGAMVMETEEQFDVVVTLENGYWRVRHLRRLGGSTIRATINNDQQIVVRPKSATGATAPKPLHGINYEPRDTPFDKQWANFDERVVANDFDTIAKLGLDSVRIFLPFLDFGGETPKEQRLSEVERLLDLANDRKLRVVITLFDGRVDHRPARWPGDEFHLQKVIARLRDHPALAMWDIKNEPERDEGIYASKLEVRAWLAHMVTAVRSLDPNTPITIGWAKAENAADPGMSELVDVVNFHWYRPTKELRTAIEKVRVAALGRPVMIGEYGLPTWNSVFPGGHTEPEQAAYYAELLTIAKDEGISSTMAWTLHDLKSAPAESKFPWQVGPQTSLGILRLDGSPKPAAATLMPGANLSDVPRMGLMSRFSKTFWKLTFSSIVAMAVPLVFFGSRFRRRFRSPFRRPFPKRLFENGKQNTPHGEVRAIHSNSSSTETSTK